MRGEVLTHARIHRRILWLPSSEAIHIPVVHTKGSSDQNRVVNFQIGRPLLARGLHTFGRDMFAALLDLAGNHQQRLELVGNRRLEKVTLYLVDQPRVLAQVSGGCGATGSPTG